MSQKEEPESKLRLAPWWVMAVVIGYLVFNILGSRIVQSMLHR